jgi:hypothetical protein
MDREQAKRFIAANKWKFASSMPYLPHSYVLREKCDEEQFVAFVELIRSAGETRPFGKKRTFIYLDLDGYSYWTMGNPIPETTVINRARIRENLSQPKRVRGRA